MQVSQVWPPHLGHRVEAAFLTQPVSAAAVAFQNTGCSQNTSRPKTVLAVLRLFWNTPVLGAPRGGL
eukprot:2665618-Prymnesium_polylepis.1